MFANCVADLNDTLESQLEIVCNTIDKIMKQLVFYEHSFYKIPTILCIL